MDDAKLQDHIRYRGEINGEYAIAYSNLRIADANRAIAQEIASLVDIVREVIAKIEAEEAAMKGGN